MAEDRRIKDEAEEEITDLSGVPLYDEAALEIFVHDCADPIDLGPGQANQKPKPIGGKIKCLAKA